MKTKRIFFIVALGLTGALAQADLLISQYVETNSGTIPKGIELWNSGSTAIDFSVTGLVVLKGTNGGAPTSDFSLNAGILAAGDVWVIGTTDIGTYLDTTFGAGVVNYSSKGFTYNGDDSLVIQLNGVTTDVFGTPNTDPGTAWTGGGVSTANQNIELIEGISTGDTVGWADPSVRFSTVSTDPIGVSGLSGFGVAPAGAIPEPSTFALVGILGVTAFGILRRSK